MIAASLDLMCGVLRVIGVVLLNNSVPPHIAFAVVLIGQAFGGLAQPLFTNNVVQMTTCWFEHHDVPTVIASMMVSTC